MIKLVFALIICVFALNQLGATKDTMNIFSKEGSSLTAFDIVTSTLATILVLYLVLVILTLVFIIFTVLSLFFN